MALSSSNLSLVRMSIRRRLPSARAVAPKTPCRPTGSSPTGERTDKGMSLVGFGRSLDRSNVLGVFRILRWFSRSGSGADENKAADKFGMAYRKSLRDISPDREAEQIDLRKAERPDEIGGVLRHRIDRVRRLAARRGDPRIVEQNDRPIFRKAVGDRGIPMIHSAPKMLHEKKRRAALLSEPAIGEANPVGFNELRGGRDVLVCHIRSSSSALARTHRDSFPIASKKDRLP